MTTEAEVLLPNDEAPGEARQRKHVPLHGREDEIMPQLFERMADGESVLSICRKEKWNRATINLWCHSPKWSDQYQQARQALGAWWGDRVVEAAEEAARERDHARIAGLRVLVDALKWSAARLNFKEYGDRMDVTSNGARIGVIALPEEKEPVDVEFELAEAETAVERLAPPAPAALMPGEATHAEPESAT